MRPSLSALLLFVCLGFMLPPGPSTAEDESPATRAEVEVRPLEGSPFRGRLLGLDASTATLATGSGERRVSLGEVRAIRRVAEAEETAATGGPGLRLRLVGGEEIRGTYAGSSDAGIRIESSSAGKVLLPYDSIRTLARIPQGAGPCEEPEAKMPASSGKDVLSLENGDTYEGLLLGVDDDGFLIEGEGGTQRRIGWEGVEVLRLENEAPPPAEGLVLEIESTDGSRWIPGEGPTLVEGTVRFTLRSSPKSAVALPVAEVAVVRPSGGAFVYADQLPFESTVETPYGFGVPDDLDPVFLQQWFGARVDRRPTGCPLTLAGRTYRHGFAVHARSRITLSLGGTYRRFQTTFGVDDEVLRTEAGPAASPGAGDVQGVVDARVLVDGEVAWQAKGVRAGATPREVGPIDVSGHSTLVLEVDYGDFDQFVGDRGTWADPILVK